jgi:hypothetical protein
MVAAAEQTLVEHRHLHHRYLQPPHQGLERIRQMTVVEDALEQHGDQVDHIFIGRTDDAQPAASGLGPVSNCCSRVRRSRSLRAFGAGVDS